MNFYPFHIGDYAAHTAHLEPMEDLAYRRLLDLYYTRQEPLPDAEACARLIRLRSHVREVSGVLSEFFIKTEAGFTHKRCDAELAKFAAMAEGGKRGAAKRWAKAGDSPPIAPPSPPQAPPNANQEPRTKNQEPEEEREPTVLVGTAYRPPPSPNAEIIELYRTHLPQLPGVEVLNDTRKRAIACRWREVCSDGKLDRGSGLEWFAWYFAHVSKSKFLTGQIPGKSGRVWQADFDFLMNASKFPRVVEGSYHKDTV